MHMLIYALVEASTADEALSTGKTVFDRLVGAEPDSCAVFDYYVTFDEGETTVAGKARWATYRQLHPLRLTKVKNSSSGPGRPQQKRSSRIWTR